MFVFTSTLGAIALIVALVLAAGAAALIVTGQSKYRRPAARVTSGFVLAFLVAGSAAISWNLKEQPPTPKRQPVVEKVVPHNDGRTVSA